MTRLKLYLREADLGSAISHPSLSGCSGAIEWSELQIICRMTWGHSIECHWFYFGSVLVLSDPVW
jgi:hypothetical protein